VRRKKGQEGLGGARVKGLGKNLQGERKGSAPKAMVMLKRLRKARIARNLSVGVKMGRTKSAHEKGKEEIKLLTTSSKETERMGGARRDIRRKGGDPEWKKGDAAE